MTSKLGEVMAVVSNLYDPTEEDEWDDGSFSAYEASGGNYDDAYRMGMWRGKYELARKIHQIVYGAGDD